MQAADGGLPVMVLWGKFGKSTEPIDWNARLHKQAAEAKRHVEA